MWWASPLNYCWQLTPCGRRQLSDRFCSPESASASRLSSSLQIRDVCAFRELGPRSSAREGFPQIPSDWGRTHDVLITFTVDRCWIKNLFLNNELDYMMCCGAVWTRWPVGPGHGGADGSSEMKSVVMRLWQTLVLLDFVKGEFTFSFLGFNFA